jgi:hypothetical protein
VIRATVAGDTADAPGIVQIYKNLKFVERDFETIKVDDLDVRPRLSPAFRNWLVTGQ